MGGAYNLRALATFKQTETTNYDVCVQRGYRPNILYSKSIVQKNE